MNKTVLEQLLVMIEGTTQGLREELAKAKEAVTQDAGGIEAAVQKAEKSVEKLDRSSTNGLRQEMRNAEQTVKQSAGRIQASTRTMELSFSRLTRTVRGLAGAFGIAFGVRGLVMHVNTQLRSADQMLKLTQRIGGTTESLSELQYVASQANIEFNTLTMGLQRMTRRVAEAARGTGEARGALRELGLDARELVKLPLDQRLEAIAGRLALVRSEGDRLRLAFKLFDSEGTAFLQMMTRGAEGIREMREEARRLGITLRQDQAEAAARANTEIDRMRTQSRDTMPLSY